MQNNEISERELLGFHKFFLNDIPVILIKLD